jgi:hypothetical protein
MIMCKYSLYNNFKLLNTYLKFQFNCSRLIIRRDGASYSSIYSFREKYLMFNWALR